MPTPVVRYLTPGRIKVKHNANPAARAKVAAENVNSLEMLEEQQRMNNQRQILKETAAAKVIRFTAYNRWISRTFAVQLQPLQRFKTLEERLKWRMQMRGTLPVSAMNSDKPLLDFPVLLTPLEFEALTQALPMEERKQRLKAMTSLRKKLWDLVKAEDVEELSKIYGQPTSVQQIKAALEVTDMPKINRK